MSNQSTARAKTNSRNVTAEIYIHRHGLDDIAVEVSGDYTPSYVRGANEPDDCPEVSFHKAVIAEPVFNDQIGVFIYEAGEAVNLTESEIERAEQALYEAA